MKPWALVPVKSFADAKSRLAHLDAAGRHALARALFEHVMGVLARCPEIAGVLVLTNGDDVDAAARAVGAQVMRDPVPAGETPRLGRIVDAGLAHLAQQRVRAALVLMADLPLLHGRALSRIAAALATSDAVLAPDVREQGTNALGLRPPDRIRTCFGHIDSAMRHRLALEQRGVRYTVHRSPELGVDLDVPADLALLDEHGRGCANEDRIRAVLRAAGSSRPPSRPPRT